MPVGGASYSGESHPAPGLPLYRRIAVIGLGLIGGSFGLAVRERELAAEVVGFDRDKAVLAAAVEVGAVDRAGKSLREAVSRADLVMLAMPIAAIREALVDAAPVVPDDCLITDAGSVKARIVAAGEALLGERFVGGHPMAGSERGGLEGADGGLFEDAAWAIVRAEEPDLARDPYAAALAQLVSRLGARPELVAVEAHDRAVATVSHLPHLISFAFAHTVEAMDRPQDGRRLAGPSCADMERVSGSDPELWAQILLENREQALAATASFAEQLFELETALRTGDYEAVLRALSVKSGGRVSG